MVIDMKKEKKKGDFDEEFWYYWNLEKDNKVDDWY